MRNKHFLITRFIKKEISQDKFLELYFHDIDNVLLYIRYLIDDGINKENSQIISDAIMLTYITDVDVSSFINKLSTLLIARWHTNHEDVARLLQKAAEPASIENLFAASTLKFDYLDYSDSHPFARICIKALSAINTKEAIEKLKVLALNTDEIIAGYAQKELRYKGLL